MAATVVATAVTISIGQRVSVGLTIGEDAREAGLAAGFRIQIAGADTRM